jgi:hypothetical protein
MPLALSLAITEARNAIELNTRVKHAPVKINANPVASGENNITGSPTPIKNALNNEILTPAYSLSNILVLLIGWEAMSSMNS